jgi:hypothetical protein
MPHISRHPKLTLKRSIKLRPISDVKGWDETQVPRQISHLPALWVQTMSKKNSLLLALAFFSSVSIAHMEVVGTRIGHKLEARVRSSRNRALQFDKPYDPVLSGSTTVRGTVELQRGAKQHLDGGERTTTTQEVEAVANRSN